MFVGVGLQFGLHNHDFGELCSTLPYYTESTKSQETKRQVGCSANPLLMLFDGPARPRFERLLTVASCGASAMQRAAVGSSSKHICGNTLSLARLTSDKDGNVN